MSAQPWPRRMFSVEDEDVWAGQVPCPGCGIAVPTDDLCVTCQYEVDLGLRCWKCGFLFKQSEARPDEPVCTCAVSQGNDDDLPF